MADEHESTLSEKLANLPDDFIKLYDEMGSPTPEDVAEIRQRFHMLVGNDGPGKIAGEMVFFKMYRLLRQEEMLTMGELSEKLKIETYTATRLVSWWVEKGFAERSGDPNDRRIVRIALTENGRQFHEIMESVIMRRVLRIMGRLTTDEQITFLSLVQKIADRGGNLK
ncbi:MAG: MarR family transcriptional regulator [Dehalococcoidia bacterium]|nr:MarR family transcriptional regulator [Dehalococcoidia bacterium]